MAVPPYYIIGGAWSRGNLVAFVGAGASLIGRPDPHAAWNNPSSAFYPKASELAEFLAIAAKFPSDDPNERCDLAKVSSYYALAGGRGPLRAELRKALGPLLADGTPRCQPGEIHKLLASLPGPQVIVVTNYDTLVEQAFDAVNRPYHLLVYPADRKSHGNATMWIPHGEKPSFIEPNNLDLDFSETIIFKMHGSISQDDKLDSFVITEEDYVDFLSRMTATSAIPAQILDYLRHRSLLFLGYSLRDWNLRLILRNLNTVLMQGQPIRMDENGDEVLSWSIQLHPSPVETELWGKRSVKIYDQNVEEFARQVQPEIK